ncbi:MAG: hypothetical protein ABI151_12010 [Chitinophagaceae bacterium]
MKFLFVLCMFFSLQANAQNCDVFPADCPETGDMEAAQDSGACIRNLILSQEIAMQNQLREKFKNQMQEIADARKWEMYEYTEMAGAGASRHKANGDMELVPYNIRPPYEYSISFIFIINKDSLNAWHSWYYNDFQNASDQLVDSYKNGGSPDVNDLEKYKRKITLAYRNASMIRIKFEINPKFSSPSSSETIRDVGKLNYPGATLAALYHNTAPDENEIYSLNQYTRCADLGYLLFGSWDLKADESHYFHARFSLDKMNTDLVTVKKIPCDRLRTMAVHIEGSILSICEFIQSLDLSGKTTTLSTFSP